MNQNQNLDSFTPTSQAAIMKEAECPVAPTKPCENQSRQSYMRSSFSTPQSAAGSTQSATPSSTGVEEHLQDNGVTSATKTLDAKRTFWHNKDWRRENKKLGLRNKSLRDENSFLKARVEQLTTACDDMNREKTCSDQEHKDIIFEIFAAYVSAQGLNVNDLTSEIVEEIWNTIYSEAEASKHLRAKVKDLEVQTEALNKDLLASRLQCKSLEEQQYEQEVNLQDSLRDLELCQGEARSLRTQVQVLQKEMLAQVSNNEVISDEVFSRDFRALASLIKSQSRSVQLLQDVDILEALKPNLLLQDVPKYHWDTRARKKAYVEAWIWSVLISTVFQYFFRFCEELMVLHDTWCLILGGDWFDNWPKPTPESETWRFTTVDKLIEDIGRETLLAGQNHEDRRELNAHAHHLQKEVLKRRAYVTNTISSYLTAVAPTSGLSYVSEIVEKAFALALNMSLQRFRVQVTWPDIGDSFEANYMTPVPDRNGEDICRGVVASIVNPGLTRWGNTHGQNFDTYHDIVPSLVQLEPVQMRRKASHVLIHAKHKPEGVQE